MTITLRLISIFNSEIKAHSFFKSTDKTETYAGGSAMRSQPNSNREQLQRFQAEKKNTCTNFRKNNKDNLAWFIK